MPTHRSPGAHHAQRSGGRVMTAGAMASTRVNVALLLATPGPDGLSPAARVSAVDVVQKRIAPVAG